MEDTPGLEGKSEGRYNACYAYLYALVLALGSFQYGYSMGISGVFNNVATEIDSNVGKYLVILISGGALLGTILMMKIVDILGRRRILILGNLYFIITLALQSFTFLEGNLPIIFLIVGRFLEGTVIGVFGVTVPLFCTEYAFIIDSKGDSTVRDTRSVMYIPSTSTMGNAASFCVDRIINTNSNKDNQIRNIVRLVLPAAIALLQNILLWTVFIQESPKYTILYDDITACEEAIAPIYPDQSERSKELLELKLLKEDVKPMDKYREVRFRDLIKSGLYRYSFARALCKRLEIKRIVMMFFQQMSGINLIIFFSAKLFNPDWSFLITVANFSMTVIVFFIVDRVGRKPLLVTGSIGMTVLLFVNMLRSMVCMLRGKDDFDKTQSFLLVVFIIYAAVFGFSYGPVGNIYVNELPPTKGFVCTMILHWTLTLAVTLPFAWISKKSDPLDFDDFPYYLYFSIGFFIFTAISILFTSYSIKETKCMYPKEIKYLHAPPGEKSLRSSIIEDDY